jgi:hypothetical protein
MELYKAPAIYERVIHQDDSKYTQIKLTVNTFKGVEYIHLRKYYLDFTEEWLPSSDGIAFPIDFINSKELFIGLIEILSLAESKELLEEHFKEVLDHIYQK